MPFDFGRQNPDGGPFAFVEAGIEEAVVLVEDETQRGVRWLLVILAYIGRHRMRVGMLILGVFYMWYQFVNDGEISPGGNLMNTRASAKKPLSNVMLEVLVFSWILLATKLLEFPKYSRKKSC